MVKGLELDDLYSLFQTKQFYDSITIKINILSANIECPVNTLLNNQILNIFVNENH